MDTVLVVGLLIVVIGALVWAFRRPSQAAPFYFSALPMIVSGRL